MDNLGISIAGEARAYERDYKGTATYVCRDIDDVLWSCVALGIASAPAGKVVELGCHDLSFANSTTWGVVSGRYGSSLEYEGLDQKRGRKSMVISV